jgi:hypothetical protein
MLAPLTQHRHKAQQTINSVGHTEIHENNVGHETFFTQMGVLAPFHVAFENEGRFLLKMYETKMWQAR